MSPTVNQSRTINRLQRLAWLMDSQFKIPGTDFRFGWDALIGLIPGAGDIATMGVSVYIMVVAAGSGASGYVLARMALNIATDTLFGSIPLLGDLFDMAFKANQRNMKLMREHYTEGRHRGSVWKVIVPILIILLLLVGGMVWLSYKVVLWLITLYFAVGTSVLKSM